MKKIVETLPDWKRRWMVKNGNNRKSNLARSATLQERIPKLCLKFFWLKY